MFEYIYTPAQYKRSITVLVATWLANFVARVVLFVIYGELFYRSMLNGFMLSFSGILVGLIIRTLVIRKKSVLVALSETDEE